MIRDLAIVFSSVLISLTLIMAFFIKEPPKVVVVDNDVLFREFVLSISESVKSQDEEEINAKIEIHRKAVDLFHEEIAKIAKENNLIILNKSNVIGGVEDQTDQAKVLLKQLMVGLE